jgi:hypothetical protein
MTTARAHPSWRPEAIDSRLVPIPSITRHEAERAPSGGVLARTRRDLRSCAFRLEGDSVGLWSRALAQRSLRHGCVVRAVVPSVDRRAERGTPGCKLVPSRSRRASPNSRSAAAVPVALAFRASVWSLVGAHPRGPGIGALLLLLASAALLGFGVTIAGERIVQGFADHPGRPRTNPDAASAGTCRPRARRARTGL